MSTPTTLANAAPDLKYKKRYSCCYREFKEVTAAISDEGAGSHVES